MKRLAPLFGIIALTASASLAQQGGHTHPTQMLAQAAKDGAKATDVSAMKPADKDALIKDALSAAPPLIKQDAKVMDWDGKVLKEGSGDYTCLPTHPDKRKVGGKEPMCLDKVWLALGDAWMNKKPFEATSVGIGYMMNGDAGASNTDPYATKPTSDNQWIAEGAHVMVVVPDEKALEGLSTDPKSGGAYVMWKGTPYVHIMVPVGDRPAQPSQ